VLPDSTRPRLLLTDGDSLQLATLIANMVEDHLRAAASVEQGMSCEQEVRNDREDHASTLAADGLRLRAPVEHGTSTARGLGWPPSRIKVLDGDLGCSGASTTDRTDFKTLVADVSLGNAGAVLALEASRLARSNADWHRLIEICGITRTLLIDEDGCYDPSDFNDGLLLGLK
jgi:hypothetical protein